MKHIIISNDMLVNLANDAGGYVILIKFSDFKYVL